MEISKENIYDVKYTSILKERNSDKRKRTSNLKRFIRENKIISISIVLFIMCVGMNLILIYNFMKILQEVSYWIFKWDFWNYKNINNTWK